MQLIVIYYYIIIMELRDNLIGGIYHKKGFKVEISKENIKLLKALKADVFKPKKEKVEKFKGIKEDDNSNK